MARRRDEQFVHALELAAQNAAPGEDADVVLARADAYLLWLQGLDPNRARRLQVERDQAVAAIAQIAAIAQPAAPAALEAGT